MLKDRRIHVNAVSPGLTETAGLNRLFGGGEQADATKDYLVGQIPVGRIGQPDDIPNPHVIDCMIRALSCLRTTSPVVPE